MTRKHVVYDTPLPKKLGIKEGFRVALLQEPPDFRSLLVPMPENVTLLTEVVEGMEPLNVIVFFTVQAAELTARVDFLARHIVLNGALWLAHPKKKSGIETDLTSDSVQLIGLAAGLVDNKVCAVDSVWSALRFVVRVNDRKQGGTQTDHTA